MMAIVPKSAPNRRSGLPACGQYSPAAALETVPDNPAGHLPKYQPVPWLTGMALPELRGSLLLHLINDARGRVGGLVVDAYRDPSVCRLVEKLAQPA